MSKIDGEINKTSENILRKAYETGAITNSEFSWVISNMLVGNDRWILDTGGVENSNAEIVLRLKDKVKDIRKVFWK